MTKDEKLHKIFTYIQDNEKLDFTDVYEWAYINQLSSVYLDNNAVNAIITFINERNKKRIIKQ